MARGRVKHELISNESVRKVSFRKRKAGLLKKFKEFTTLCGVVACAIIFGPYNQQPEIWPSPEEAAPVLNRFNSTPEGKKNRYMMNEEAILRREVAIRNRAIERQRKLNQNLEIEIMLTKYIADKDSPDWNSITDLPAAADLLDKKIEALTKRIKEKEAENQSQE